MSRVQDFRNYTNAEDEALYLKESVDIVPEAIREEFVRVPSDLAYWGEKYADATRAYLLAEAATKRTRAQLSLQIREVAATKNQKMTVDQVDAWIEATAEYQTVKLAEIEAEAAKLAAKVRYEAVGAKKDMCMSLGAAIRQEQELGNYQMRRRDG